MMKLLTSLCFLFASAAALACPYCAGSTGNEGDQYIVYVLGGFILLTYIPFYILFRLTKKKKINNVVE